MSIIDHWDVARFTLGLLIVVCNWGVWRGVRLEESFVPWEKETGKRLLANSLAWEFFFAMTLLVVDTVGSVRQKMEIADLYLKFAPRSQLLSGHESELIEQLAKYDGTKFDCSMGANSAEQATFWHRLELILVDAHWVHVGYHGMTQPLGAYNSPPFDQPFCGPATVPNVAINAAPGTSDKFAGPAAALASALNKIQIAATIGAPIDVNGNRDVLHISVGEKE